ALQGGERGEMAAERMPHSEHGLAVAPDLLDLFRDQMRPAVGDRMARIVADGVHVADLEVAPEIGEHLAVARGGKTVGVREMQNGHSAEESALSLTLALSQRERESPGPRRRSLPSPSPCIGCCRGRGCPDAPARS